jgi:hypothetical protein
VRIAKIGAQFRLAKGKEEKWRQKEEKKPEDQYPYWSSGFFSSFGFSLMGVH